MSCSLFTPTIKDEKLTPYVNKFAKDMNVDQEDLFDYTVRFLTLSGVKSSGESKKVIGQCTYAVNIVDIDPNFWYSKWTTEKSRVALVYHELGHCYCKIVKHVKGSLPDHCPTSIMDSTLPPASCLKRHWQYYIDDLKERCD